MKKLYEEPSAEVVMLVAENVIVTSSGGLNEEQWTENGEGQTGFDQWAQ